MPWTDPGMLERRVGHALNGIAAAELLAQAEALVEDWAGFPLLQAPATKTVEWRGDQNRFYLGQRATGLTVARNGAPVSDPENYVLEEETRTVHVKPLASLAPGDRLTFSYTRGYQPVPDSLVAPALNAAARAVEASCGVKSEGLGDWNLTFEGPGGLYLTDAEREMIDDALARHA